MFCVLLSTDRRETGVRDDTQTGGDRRILLRRRRRTVRGAVQRAFRDRHTVLSRGGGQLQSVAKRRRVHDSGRPVGNNHKGRAVGRVIFKSTCSAITLCTRETKN